MPVLIFFIAHWYLSLTFQTLFQHRYASHRAFTMHPFWEKVFFVLAWIAQGSSYLSPRAYAIMHRLHHAYADTEQDPHSPAFSPNLFHMMWKTKVMYTRIFEGKVAVEERFLKNVPDWPLFDRFANSTFSRLLWMAAYTLFYVKFAPSPWWYLLLPLQFSMCVLHGAIINWFAHKYGYRNFKVSNTSENLFHFDFLMLGESYHNNHHKRPSSPNFGVRWHEFDPVYPLILLLNRVGIIRLPKPARSLAAAETTEHESVK